MSYLKKAFSLKKPVLGMVHLPPLPGTPYYRGQSVSQMIDLCMQDALVLKENGFDGLMFANEGDRPYVTEVGPEVTATYARIVSTVTQEMRIPFGVGVLMDPRATMALALATGAHYFRTYLTGIFAGTFGFHAASPGELMRYRSQIGADKIPLFCNITPHAGVSVDTRPLPEIVDTALMMLEPDVILIPGPRAGKAPSLSVVAEIKKAFPEQELLISSGVGESNVREALSIADGVLVGTALKADGVIWNQIDPGRAARFMSIARHT